MTRQEVAGQVGVWAVLLKEAAPRSPLKRSQLVARALHNITTQERGNVFADYESWFDVSVLPDGTGLREGSNRINKRPPR